MRVVRLNNRFSLAFLRSLETPSSTHGDGSNITQITWKTPLVSASRRPLSGLAFPIISHLLSCFPCTNTFSESQVEKEARERESLQSSLLEVHAKRSALEASAREERRRRDVAEATCQEAKEKCARLEEALAGAQSGASAAARDLQELGAKLEVEVEKVSTGTSNSWPTIDKSCK
jgi:hypothetical protein